MKNRFKNVPVPVQEGEVREVTIESLGDKGDGVAKVQGFVIIVPNTQRGERVRIRITAVRGRVGFGTIIAE